MMEAHTGNNAHIVSMSKVKKGQGHGMVTQIFHVTKPNIIIRYRPDNASRLGS